MSSERAEADTVSLEVSEGIAWVRFNRPEKRNCMSPKLNRQMRRIIEDVEFRDDVRVLVLAGAGEAWSAGMDLKEYFRETEAEGLGAIRRQRPLAQTPTPPLRPNTRWMPAQAASSAHPLRVSVRPKCVPGWPQSQTLLPCKRCTRS